MLQILSNSSLIFGIISLTESLSISASNKIMAIYGISGSHTTDACPLNNDSSAKTVLQAEKVNLEELGQKYKINKIIGQYHSALEHTFLWIVDADDPHLIQQFCIEGGIASFNAIKIVPMITFDQAIETIKKVNPQ